MKLWLELDSIKTDRITREAGNVEIAEAIGDYLIASLGGTKELWLSLPWKVALEWFFLVERANLPSREIPLLMSKVQREKPLAWHYAGRTWFMWADIFASEYGWGLEKTASLTIDEGIALMQEILSRRQLEREWDWMRSEVAYPYNKNTKKQEFKPIDRPDFMRPTVESVPIPKIRMPKSFLPVGNVVDVGKMQEHFEGQK